MALLTVLWVLILLTMLAISAANAVRTQAQASHSAFREAQRKALRESALNRAIQLSADQLSARHLALGEGSVPVEVFGETVHVVLENEHSRTDLNTASDDALASVLQLGIPDAGARDRLIAAIHDWKDADDAPQPLGAEAWEYHKAGRPYRPTNAPFEREDELAQVLGAGEGLLGCLSNRITVYSHQSVPSAENEQATISSYAGHAISLTIANERKFVGRSVIWMSGDDRRPAVVLQWLPPPYVSLECQRAEPPA